MFFRGMPSILPAGEAGKLKSINSFPPKKLRKIFNPGLLFANYNPSRGL